MATYYVSEAGDNGAGTSWATAKTTLAAALALATASGDVVLVDKDHTGDNAYTTDKTWTALNHISVVVVDKDNSNSLSAMGEAAWFGSLATSINLSFDGGFRVRLHGLTFRNGGGSGRDMTIGNSDGCQILATDCYFWLGTSSSSSNMYFGTAYTTINTVVELVDCTLRFGATGQKLSFYPGSVITNTTISASGSIPSPLLISPKGGTVTFHNCDLTSLGTASIIGICEHSALFVFNRCKMPSNYSLLSSQTPANRSAGSGLLLDCSSGDTHGIMHYVDSLGSVVSDTSIYFTDGAAGQSWKIVTTSSCSHAVPFTTPWIPVYHTDTSAITPRFEILRDGSTTAYQTNEIGAEFSAKVTSGSVISTRYTDYMPLLSTAADQAAGAGTASWTGDTGAWSGKIDSGAAITPAENGEILGRAIIGGSGITVYLDPQIRW
jgi:hypothetical protein